MRISLTVKAGPHEGKVFAFEEHDNFIVGRSAHAHFALPVKDKAISRIHFMVEVNPPQCRLIDMESTNGTKVNGQKVTITDLKDGDLITAGLTVLLVSVTGSDDRLGSPETLLPLPQAAGALDAVFQPISFSTMDFPLPPPLPLPLPLPQPSRPSSREPGCCRVCGVLLPGNGIGASGEQTTAHVIPLCPACRDQIRNHPQPISGYRVVRELGRGGLGVVYLALRAVDGSLVALKTIVPAVAASRVDIERFLREAHTLNELVHPNIVEFHEMGESNGLFHFAMDYVAGVDAAQLQTQHRGPLPITRAVDLVCQLLQALDYAHAKGFVHRDIKPANMLVTQNGSREVVKLTDFGLARVYKATKLSGLTMNGDLGGTAAYIAPEQISELRTASPTVDQYSTGATLYKLLTDRYIYDLPSRLEQQVMKILLMDPVPILERRPDLPEPLAAIIDRALARDPQARFANVRDMRRALAPFGQ